MENLTINELQQLVKFYKDKSSDLELQYLMLQLNAKKEIITSIEKQKEESKNYYSKELSIAHTRLKELEDAIIKINKKNKTKQEKISNKKEK